MLWLRLVYYALRQQRVWVTTSPDLEGYWFARVRWALPGIAFLEVAPPAARTAVEPMVVATRAIVCVRERWVEGERELLTALADAPARGDDPDERIPLNV